MDRKEKKEMLSVVALGIHRQVRQDLQNAVDSTIQNNELRRHVRPFFFYEYFLDTPVVHGHDVGNDTSAFAPFFRRLVSERDFVPAPPGHFSGLTPEECRNLVAKRAFPMAPANESAISEHWSSDISFTDAVNKSLVLNLLYKGWRENSKSIRMLEYFTEIQTKCFVNPQMEAFGDCVSFGAGFSSRFARDRYLKNLDELSGTNQESALREFSVVIYPWLLSADQIKAGKSRREDTRLFEMLACSISSRSLLFGELILYVPPIQNTELRMLAYANLSEVLRLAVRKYYVPLLTLYENYVAEKDFGEALKAELTKLSPNRHEQEFFGKLGLLGRPISLIPKASEQSELIETLESKNNVFLRLASHVPLDISSLNKLTQLLDEIDSSLNGGAGNLKREELFKEWRGEVVRLQEVLSTSIEGQPWRADLQHILDKASEALADNWQKSISSLKGKLVNFAQTHGTALSDIEKSLVGLWAHRIGSLPLHIQEVYDTLVFGEYVIASPGMVKCIKQAMTIRHMRKNKSVKTALVFGEAGSGKDSMARLAHLFSPGYRFGKKCVLNMAMLRPREIAVPVLLGFKANMRDGDLANDVKAGKGFFLEGLLAKADAASEKNQGGGEFGFTFVFDELNSLDIDTQGALLRVLENGELRPLGSIEHTDVDFLIIGVMNEDPQLIMKKQNLDRVLRDKDLFGGIIGESLYEILRTQRRLRDDLYYRFARGGEIRVPELRNRREDIPILVFFFIKDFIQLMPQEVQQNREIDFSAYDVLMDPALPWEGNARELQAVTKLLVEAAVAEYQHNPTVDGRLTIRRQHAIKALEIHKKQQGGKDEKGKIGAA